MRSLGFLLLRQAERAHEHGKTEAQVYRSAADAFEKYAFACSASNPSLLAYFYHRVLFCADKQMRGAQYLAS